MRDRPPLDRPWIIRRRSGPVRRLSALHAVWTAKIGRHVVGAPRATRPGRARAKIVEFMDRNLREIMRKPPSRTWGSSKKVPVRSERVGPNQSHSWISASRLHRRRQPIRRLGDQWWIRQCSRRVCHTWEEKSSNYCPLKFWLPPIGIVGLYMGRALQIQYIVDLFFTLLASMESTAARYFASRWIRQLCSLTGHFFKKNSVLKTAFLYILTHSS